MDAHTKQCDCNENWGLISPYWAIFGHEKVLKKNCRLTSIKKCNSYRLPSVVWNADLAQPPAMCLVQTGMRKSYPEDASRLLS